VQASAPSAPLTVCIGCSGAPHSDSSGSYEGVDRFAARCDEQLLAERAPSDAVQAFAAFFGRHEPVVLGYLHRRVRDAELAADLGAETFAQAVVWRYRFRPRRHRLPLVWLLALARGVFERSLKRGRVQDRYRRRLALEFQVPRPEHLDAIERWSRELESSLALEDLHPGQREAIRAHVLADDAHAPAIQQLHASNRVKNRRALRGLTAFRQHLQKEQA
jgi:DNA-directed RNA polymerase specialized sigma24 family protein